MLGGPRTSVWVPGDTWAPPGVPTFVLARGIERVEGSGRRVEEGWPKKGALAIGPGPQGLCSWNVLTDYQAAYSLFFLAATRTSRNSPPATAIITCGERAPPVRVLLRSWNPAVRSAHTPGTPGTGSMSAP